MMHALTTLLLVAVASAAPITYDQRQEGEFNVLADVRNIMLLAVYPSKVMNLLPLFKSADRRSDMRNGGDTELLEAFLEPGTPYRVEIAGKSSASDVQAEVDAPAPPVLVPLLENERYSTDAERDGKVVEISGRRRDDNTIAAEEKAPTAKTEEEVAPEEPLKLLGALEQCGPGRARDHEGVCQEAPAALTPTKVV